MLKTCCSNCQSILPVGAAQLRQAGGVVVCPQCRKVFNALASLTDGDAGPADPPADRTSASAGMPPVLEPLPESPAQPTEPGAAEPQGTYDPVAAGQHEQPAWSPATATMLAALPVLVAVLAWQLWTVPAGRPAAGTQPAAPLTGSAAFRLVSRDLHPHPTRSAFRVLSFRLQNTSGRARPLPEIEVDWPSGGAAGPGTRRLQPSLYASRADAGVAPGDGRGGLVIIKTAIDDGGLNVRIR